MWSIIISQNKTNSTSNKTKWKIGGINAKPNFVEQNIWNKEENHFQFYLPGSKEELTIIDKINKIGKPLVHYFPNKLIRTGESVGVKEKGFVVIVITNQSAINRGLVTIETLNKIHNYFQKFLKENNTCIDDFYFCPHRPDENCQCRKPNPGMLIKAVQDYDIDMNQSFMIGNSLTDVQAAQKAGCKGILLNQNQTLLGLVTNLIKVNFA